MNHIQNVNLSDQSMFLGTRCAIYTRKSTDEGLDQDFNSLDAQRESAEAFIESQKSEGWICLPDRYDDGGFTGANMERPALQRLLADIDAGKVDCIVVYKVDRLSRSLLDFAKIIEVLEQNTISFVSVTQQFNTTHSMGRPTLNILLSFAQFEREMIAERTRDKMSAARKKGKWTGGMPVLGYDIDPQGGRLLVNEREAERVTAIFKLYLEFRALMPTVEELNKRAWTTKRWTTKKGRERGGKPFTKNNLFKLLTNLIYLGKVKYRDKIYDGEHDAILDDGLWRQVQELLRYNGRNGGRDVRNKYGALLKGILYCGSCKTVMIHTFTVKKNGTRYRYYVCSKAQKQGWHTCPSKSLPAPEIERFVIDQIRSVGKDTDILAETLEQARSKSKKELQELEKEKRTLQRDLKRYNTEVHNLIDYISQNGKSDAPVTARLADLQDRILLLEQRNTLINEDIVTLSKEMVDENELESALSHFDPIWNSLALREQARIIQLLVERVVYNGEEGTVAVTFHPNGIKTLAQEAAINE